MTPPRYHAMHSSSSGRVAHWWDKLPAPVISVALGVWDQLPIAVRRPLARLTPVINPHAVAVGSSGSSPDTVAGVTEARAEGFTPIEELTGWLEIVTVWPEGHRRELPETRPEWLEFRPGSPLWLVRSPWPPITVEDALSLLLRGEHDSADRPREARLAQASVVLRWPESRALAALADC